MQGWFFIGSILLGDVELMEFYGVLCIVFWEVLKIFVVKGLIEFKMKVGIKVLDCNNWNMFDVDIFDWYFEMGVDVCFFGWLFEIWQMLELFVCVIVVFWCMLEQFKVMYKVFQGMYGCESNWQGFIKVDLVFYQVIFEVLGNFFLQLIGFVIGVVLVMLFMISFLVFSDDCFKEVM